MVEQDPKQVIIDFLSVPEEGMVKALEPGRDNFYESVHFSSGCYCNPAHLGLDAG